MHKRKFTADNETDAAVAAAEEAPRRRSSRNIPSRQPSSSASKLVAPAAAAAPNQKKTTAAGGGGGVKGSKVAKQKKPLVENNKKKKEAPDAAETESAEHANLDPELALEPEPEAESKAEPGRTARKAARSSHASKQPPPKAAKAKAKSKTAAAAKSGKAVTNDDGTLETPAAAVEAAANGDGDDGPAEKTYWLLKAEPDSRMANGVDVKFSIDDLAAKTEPEPWDGIRAYPARNNLRAMKKGDLAFFYASNCKEPGIVGTMEIVEEHSPDLSAHDPKAPYYDPSSKPADPKWSVVHVEFRSKFAVPIGLQELRAMGAPGLPLENMQMLKQSRLSVSKVRADEWEYLMGVAKEKAANKG